MRAERVELSMDRVHRGLSPARLPFPPRPPGAPGQRLGARGPRRARTVTSLRAGELHCLSCSGPVVRGQESNLPCPKAPGLRPGAVPRRHPADGSGGSCQGMARPRSAYWRSLQFSRIYLGATRCSHIEIWARHTSKGAGNRTPPMTVLGTVRLPAPHPSGLRSVVVGPEKQKSRLLGETAPDRSSDLCLTRSYRQEHLRVRWARCDRLPALEHELRGHGDACRHEGRFAFEVPIHSATGRVDVPHGVKYTYSHSE